MRNRWTWTGDDNSPIKRVPLEERHIRNYIRRISHSKHNNYCDNCGILIGKNHLNKIIKDYQGYDVCSGCYLDLKEEKEEGRILSTPNLNDLIDIGGMYGNEQLRTLPSGAKNQEGGGEDEKDGGAI